MYIEKYWENYIGGSDDSLTLLEYLEGKDEFFDILDFGWRPSGKGMLG